MILSLRVLPALGIAVEEQARPDLRLRPLIMGGLPHQRGTVQEANSCAQRAGIRLGMTLAQAHHYCPDGVFLIPNTARYEQVWSEICSLLRDYTPAVEPAHPGHAVCDLAGCERRWGGDWNGAAEILAAVRARTGLAPVLGLGSNRLVAELASLQANGEGLTRIAPGQEATFLADLPLTLLPGVDARLAQTFQVLGLRTAGQLAALPARAVEQRFGAEGKRLHRYARGSDDRPVQPPPEKPRVTVSYQCEEGSWEDALAGLNRLAERCAAELQSRHLAGRMIELRLSWQPPMQPAALPPAAPALPTPLPVADPPADAEIALPVSYRIHSMLPQPGALPRQPAPPVSVRPESLETAALVAACPAPPAPTDTVARSMVRTPLSSAPVLYAQAERLLQGLWPHQPAEIIPPLYALELTVSEFAAPLQLAFPELLRLEATGRLGGVTSSRLQAIDEQEEALLTRHGTPPFRHVAGLDPGSVLTERRFRWQAGLPWRAAPAPRKAGKRR